MKTIKQELKRKFEIKKFLVEFLRPTKWKIILTIILIISFFFFWLEGIEQVVILFYLPLIISGPFNIQTSGGFDIFIMPTVVSIFVALLVYVLQTYFISCLITFIYKKIRMIYIKNADSK